MLKSIASIACSWSIVWVTSIRPAPTSATLVRWTRSLAIAASASAKMPTANAISARRGSLPSATTRRGLHAEQPQIGDAASRQRLPRAARAASSPHRQYISISHSQSAPPRNAGVCEPDQLDALDRARGGERRGLLAHPARRLLLAREREGRRTNSIRRATGSMARRRRAERQWGLVPKPAGVSPRLRGRPGRGGSRSGSARRGRACRAWPGCSRGGGRPCGG